MLVGLFNAVKVESVPLNSNQLCVAPSVQVLLPKVTVLRSQPAQSVPSTGDTRLIRTYDRSVGDLASIGYNGQPARNPFRVVRPPISVLIDLTVLFPREPHRSGRFQPNGLQLHKVVEGRLTCWGICEQGDWWGLVTYPIAYGSKRKTVTHWVPAWTLRRKN
jgi:hypothetical protein